MVNSSPAVIPASEVRQESFRKRRKIPDIRPGQKRNDTSELKKDTDRGGGISLFLQHFSLQL
jgi:hypothetical protein